MNIKGLLRLATAGLLLGTIYLQYQTINKYKAKEAELKDTNFVDSLKTELFNAQSLNGRFELGLDHLKELDSDAYSEIQDFIQNETE